MVRKTVTNGEGYCFLILDFHAQITLIMSEKFNIRNQDKLRGKKIMNQKSYEIVNFEYKFMNMDIAVKKVELIEWLARLQDEKLIQRIETLKKGAIKELYEQRMPKTKEELEAKLSQSEKDIKEGKVHSQEEVESYFKARL